MVNCESKLSQKRSLPRRAKRDAIQKMVHIDEMEEPEVIVDFYKKLKKINKY